MKKHIVLLIEDNPLITEMYKSALQDNGISVFVAQDGKEGIRLTEEKLPDVVLLDLLMHETDGFEVLEHITQIRENASIKIIILSGVSSKAVHRKALDHGASAFFVKSESTLEEVVAKVTQLLG